jgi:hypothetical protein
LRDSIRQLRDSIIREHELINIMMATANASAAAAAITEGLLEEWSATAEEKKSRRQGTAPAALQLYQLGQVLHSLSEEEQAAAVRDDDSQRHYANVQRGTRDLLQSLPEDTRRKLFRDLLSALQEVLVASAKEEEEDQSRTAMQALHQLYECSPLAADSTEASPDTVSALATYYVHQRGNESLVLDLLQVQLFPFLTAGDSCRPVDFEELLPLINLLFAENDVWSDLVRHMGAASEHELEQRILSRYPDETHRGYLSSLLLDAAAATDDEELAGQIRTAVNLGEEERRAASAPPASRRRTTPEQELSRRIDQVRQILPDLGEGFVEAALSYCRGSVEQTVAALLQEEEEWPPQLRVLDRSLPRRHDRDAHVNKEEEEEARRLTQAALRAEDRQQEEDAHLMDLAMRAGAHDEYNDDYDDQYDDMEGVGGADSGLYDRDFAAIKTYNRFLKQVESEQQFWEENRNLNREPPKMKKDDAGEKTYRGPDKLRGGRVPDAARGGRGGRGQERRGRGSKSPKRDDKSSDKNGPAAAGRGDSTGRGAASGRTNPRHKANKMASRRDKQKKAAAKRSG